MASFEGRRNRDDRFIGGRSDDRFSFDPADLNRADVIVGGVGRAIDTLRFTMAGTVGASAFTNVSQIERVELATRGANDLTVTDALVSTATGARVSIIGGSGNDIVRASGLTGANAIDFISGGGTDAIYGGAGDDSFTFDIGSLDAGDRVYGYGGRNTLRLTGSGTVRPEQLSGVFGIYEIALGDGGVSISFSDEVIRAYLLNYAQPKITGGAGTDEIDLSTVTSTLINPTLNGGGGDDRITGIMTSDTWQNIDGGAGADRIRAGYALVQYDRDDISVAVSNGILFTRGPVTVDLTRVNDQTLGDTNIVTGFTEVWGELATKTLRFTGGTGHRLTGGSGDDVLSGASTIEGGKGADRLTSGAEGTTFILRDGDFAAGEIIRGVGSRDELTVIGRSDLRVGTVTGIERIYLGEGFPLAVGTLVANASQLLDLTYINGYAGVLEVTIERGTAFLPKLQGSSGVSIDVIGSSDNDIIRGGGVRNVRGGAGNDEITGSGTVAGGSGDDVVTTSVYEPGGRRIDGGDGIDALTIADGLYDFEGSVVIDLRKVDDQIVIEDFSPGLSFANFESVDVLGLRVSQANEITIIGDAVRNRISGSSVRDVISGLDGDDVLLGVFGDDTISGGDGNDTIIGGYGSDRMSGGGGSDTFQWLHKYDVGDVILDFRRGDLLSFDADEFAVSGTMLDVRQVSSTAINLTDVDLFVYTGSMLNSIDDVEKLLAKAKGGRDEDGVFVVGQSSTGHTMLYHADGSGSIYPYVKLIADLGDGVAPASIDLTTILLI